MRLIPCMTAIGFIATLNVGCATTTTSGGEQWRAQGAGADCQNLGVFPGKSTSGGLDPFPQNATEADRANWKKNMNERYISLKSEAVNDAQKAALAAGATHIQYQDAMITSQPDKTMKSSVNVIAYKCPADTSVPKNTLPANDPIPEQQGSSTFK